MSVRTDEQLDKTRDGVINKIEIIEDAVKVANRIIMDGTDGSKEETDYLTAMVAKNFMEKAYQKLCI